MNKENKKLSRNRKRRSEQKMKMDVVKQTW